MLIIDEHSKAFQREAIEYLLKKIIDSLKLDGEKKNQYFSEIKQFLEEKRISDIETLIQYSPSISKMIQISHQSLNEIIQKNYFKVLQILKKEKETYSSFLKDEKQSIIEILSKHIFLTNLSNAYFKLEDNYYVLCFPSKKVVEVTVKLPQKTSIEELPNEKIKTQNKKELENKYKEEKSIIKEIIETFLNLRVNRNLMVELNQKELMEQQTKLENNIQSKIQKEQEIQYEDSHSIIQDILDEFPRIFPISLNLQEQLLNLNLKEESSMEENSKNQTINESLENEKIINQNIYKIPLTISDYLNIRRKIYEFRQKGDTIGYQNFIHQANENIKSCIAIMNILNKEKESNFSLEKYLKNVAIKMNFSLETMMELYQRIKKYQLCIGFVKQATDYLKKSDPKLYQYFVKIYEPLLDFITLLDKNNREHYKEDFIEKNLKLLLISIQEENDRYKLYLFLKKFIDKIKPYL